MDHGIRRGELAEEGGRLAQDGGRLAPDGGRLAQEGGRVLALVLDAQPCGDRKNRG